MCLPWNHNYKPYGIAEGQSMLDEYIGNRPVYGVTLRCTHCLKRKVIAPFSSIAAAEEHLEWLKENS